MRHEFRGHPVGHLQFVLRRTREPGDGVEGFPGEARGRGEPSRGPLLLVRRLERAPKPLDHRTQGRVRENLAAERGREGVRGALVAARSVTKP